MSGAGRCPTVDINRNGVKTTINESDLQDTDVLWTDKPVVKPKPKAKTTRVRRTTK